MEFHENWANLCWYSEPFLAIVPNSKIFLLHFLSNRLSIGIRKKSRRSICYKLKFYLSLSLEMMFFFHYGVFSSNQVTLLRTFSAHSCSPVPFSILSLSHSLKRVLVYWPRKKKKKIGWNLVFITNQSKWIFSCLKLGLMWKKTTLPSYWFARELKMLLCSPNIRHP